MIPNQLTNILLWIIILTFANCNTSYAQDHLSVEIVGVSSSSIQKGIRKILTLEQYPDYALSSTLALQSAFDQGIKQIKTYLENQGYFHPSVKGLCSYDQDSTTWNIIYTIALPPPMKVTAIILNVIGDLHLKQKLMEKLEDHPLQVGTRLVSSQYEDVKDILLNLANNRGYFDAQLTQNQIRVNPQENTAKILLTLQSGTRYKIGTTRFTQHPNILSPEFLKRYIPYQLSQSYNINKINHLEQRLDASDYFLGTSVVPLPDHKTKTVPINVNLFAHKQFRYSIGAGYGTDTGIRGLLGWKWRYITQDGQYANARILASRIYAIYTVNYVFPGNDPLYENTTLNATRDETNITAYDAVDASFGIRKTILWHQISTTFALNQHFIHFFTPENTQGSYVRYLIPSISLKLSHRIHTIGYYWYHGWMANALFKGTISNNLLSTTSFAQGNLELRESFNFSPNNRFFARQTIGATWMTGNIRILSPTLRYYVGGINSIRGFHYKSLGLIDSRHNLLGGMYIASGSLNLEHHLFDNWSAYIFTDSGTAVNSLNNITFYRAAGVGLSWRSPIGPLSAYLAHPIDYPDDGWQFNISIGAFIL